MKILLTMLLFFSSFSHASGDDNQNHSVCLQVLKNLKGTTDIETLTLCSDFFWHHGEYDNGSFNNVIAIEKRIVQLAPRDIDGITNVIWLLWSKWISWKKDPNSMPDGEFKVEEALEFIKECDLKNFNNFEFYLRVALQLDPLIKNYRIDLLPLSLQYYTKVTMLIPRTANGDILSRRLRAELNLGHWYSYKNLDIEKAIYWYNQALTTEPSNKVAQRRLNEIKGPHLR